MKVGLTVFVGMCLVGGCRQPAELSGVPTACSPDAATPGDCHLRAACPDAGSVAHAGLEASPPAVEIPILPRSGGKWSPDEPEPSEARMHEIRRDAALLAPAGDSLWFIVLISSDSQGYGYLARVFYAPWTRKGRLRKGTCLVLSSYTTKWKELLREGRTPCATVWKSGTYYQVSATAKPFSEELDLPMRFLLPFEITGRFDDGEIVRIVDRTRRVLKHWQPTSRFFGDWHSLPYRAFTIIDRSVGSQENTTARGGDIEMRIGEHKPRPPNRGLSVMLRRAPDGLKVVGICEWRSCS